MQGGISEEILLGFHATAGDLLAPNTKTDELASNYLYQLNAAARRAGFDYRSRPSDLHYHLQHFFDILHNTALEQFRIRTYTDIDKLEEILIQYETAQVRPQK